MKKCLKSVLSLMAVAGSIAFVTPVYSHGGGGGGGGGGHGVSMGGGGGRFGGASGGGFNGGGHAFYAASGSGQSYGHSSVVTVPRAAFNGTVMPGSTYRTYSSHVTAPRNNYVTGHYYNRLNSGQPAGFGSYGRTRAPLGGTFAQRNWNNTVQQNFASQRGGFYHSHYTRSLLGYQRGGTPRPIYVASGYGNMRGVDRGYQAYGGQSQPARGYPVVYYNESSTAQRQASYTYGQNNNVPENNGYGLNGTQRHYIVSNNDYRANGSGYYRNGSNANRGYYDLDWGYYGSDGGANNGYVTASNGYDTYGNGGYTYLGTNGYTVDASDDGYLCNWNSICISPIRPHYSAPVRNVQIVYVLCPYA
jgi:hypothetical protein